MAAVIASEPALDWVNIPLGLADELPLSLDARPAWWWRSCDEGLCGKAIRRAEKSAWAAARLPDLRSWPSCVSCAGKEVPLAMEPGADSCCCTAENVCCAPDLRLAAEGDFCANSDPTSEKRLLARIPATDMARLPTEMSKAALRRAGRCSVSTKSCKSRAKRSRLSSSWKIA